MTIFNVKEKHQKSRFCLQFFLLKSSLQTQKSTFTAKFSPSTSLQAIYFASILCSIRARAVILLYSHLVLIFLHYDCIALWEMARNFEREGFLPDIFHIFTKSTATPTYHRNFAMVVFFSGRNFQKKPW